MKTQMEQDTTKMAVPHALETIDTFVKANHNLWSREDWVDPKYRSEKTEKVKATFTKS